MTACRDRHACLRQLPRLTRGFVVDEIAVGCLHPPRIVGEQACGRSVCLEQRLRIDISRLPPIRITRQTAIGHAQCRRVGDPRLAIHLHHIVVEHFQRDVVLQRIVAVRDQVHVHAVERPTFGHDLHVFETCRLDHLLALLAARLIVVLDRMAALRLQPPDMRQRIVEAVDLRINVRRPRAVNDFAGRIDARGNDQPGALHFRRGKDLARPVRWVVNRGGSQSEVLDHRPVGLRDQFPRPRRAMRVRIDQAGDDRLTCDVDRGRASRNLHAGARTDRGDAVVTHDDHAVVDHTAALARHRDDARTGQHGRPAVDRRILLHRQRHARCRRDKAGRALCARCHREKLCGID